MSHTPTTWVGRFPGIDGVIKVNVAASGPAPTFDVPGSLRFHRQLHPVLPFAPEKFRHRVGEYTDGDITLVVSMNSDATIGRPFPFYADLDHDAVVPLYPISANTMLSEQGEELIFGEDGGLVLSVDDCKAELSPATSHAEEEVSIPVSGTPTVLSGTLLRPKHSEPVTGVIIAHAAAWHQRDFYRIFAHGLVSAGVAVLIYDRQGYGSSTGDATASLRSNAADLEAAIDFLDARDDIASVGLWGISNGMWTVPLVAARRPDVAFVAGVSAPGVTMSEAEVHRRSTALRQGGVDEAAAEIAAVAWRILLGVRITGSATADSVAELEGLLDKLRGNASVKAFQLPEYAVVSPQLSPLPPLGPAAETIALFAKQPDPEMGYDPANSYRVIGCPVLLQHGTVDTNVPTAVSQDRIRTALSEGGNEQFTLSGYEGAGHFLETVSQDVDGMTYEQVSYLLHRFRLAPGAITELKTWIAQVTRGDEE